MADVQNRLDASVAADTIRLQQFLPLTWGLLIPRDLRLWHFAALQASEAEMISKHERKYVLESLEPRFLLDAVPVGPEFRINTWTTGYQRYPSIAMDVNGDFVAVWESYNNNHDGVYAQRYNATGLPQGGEFRVNTYTTDTQSSPSIAMDAGGDFVITWDSYGQDGSGYGVYAQRFDAAAIPQGGEFRVNTYTTDSQTRAKIAMDAGGDFVVTWDSNTQDGSGYGVYAQRFDAAAIPQGGEFRVNTYTTDTQSSPSIAMNAVGDFVVAWLAHGVFAQRFSAAGVPQGSEFRVTTQVSLVPFFPASIAMTSDGSFVIAWEGNEDIYARDYNAVGEPQSAFRVNTYTPDWQFLPSIGMDGDGDYVIAWCSEEQDGSLSGVYAQQYSAQPIPPFEVLARGVAYNDQWFNGESVVWGGVSLGYTVDHVFNDPQSGFYALGLNSSVYGPALVFRGTENVLDWWDNATWQGVGYGQFSSNWTTVSTWLNTTRTTLGAIDFIGHSLGGALAQWFASEWTSTTDPPIGTKLIDDAVTFNSPGISNAGAMAFQASEANSVTHYIVNGDVVSMAGQRYIPGQVEMASFSDWSMWDFDKHLLPLTVPSIAGPNGEPPRIRPADLAFDPNPISVDQLSSPSYVHTDINYKMWVAGLQIASDALANTFPALWGIQFVPQALESRAGTETARASIGYLFQKTVNGFGLLFDTLDRTKVYFQGLGNNIYNRLKLTVDNSIGVTISRTSDPELIFSGGIGLDYSTNALTLNLPAWLGGPVEVNALLGLTGLDASGHIDGTRISVSGNYSLLGGLLSANGAGSLDWSRGDLGITGSINLFNGFITANGTIRVANGSELTVGGSASIVIPSGVPIIGGTPLSGGSYQLRVSDDGTLADDFVAAWGIRFGKQIGLRVHFDGNWDFLDASEIAALGSDDGRESTEGRSFQIAPSTEWSVLSAEWTVDSSTAAIRVIDPTGHIFSEADILADPTMEITADLTTLRRRAVLINNPMAGTWRIELIETTGLGTPSFAAIGSVGDAPIGTALTAVGGELRAPVNISLTVANSTPTTRVSLFYDTDNSGNDGIQIADGLAVTGGVVMHNWEPLVAPIGPLYIYAVVTDNNQQPGTLYSTAPVNVSEVRPQVENAAFDPDAGTVVKIRFSQDVSESLGTNDFVVENLTTGTALPAGQMSINYDLFTQIATLTLTPNMSLADGNYRLRVLGAGVTNSAGTPIADDFVFNFFFLGGDANHDARVNLLDFNILAGNFNQSGRTFSQGDFNYDGQVNLLDFNILASRFNTSLAANGSIMRTGGAALPVLLGRPATFAAKALIGAMANSDEEDSLLRSTFDALMLS